MARSQARSPLSGLLDFVGSVPFGVSVLIAILLYCWIGSAGLYPLTEWFVRQSVEKTEMEWFTWWPFRLMVVALCVAVILVTVRKIPFNLPKLGVWTVHVGIVMMSIGCFVYFGTKLEGDMAVFRREVVLSAPGAQTTRLLLQPGSQGFVQGGKSLYRVQVSEVNPSYELLTGEDKGKRTASVQLMVQPWKDGVADRPFVRQLLLGYPQYTEDVLPGQGRAIKVIGRKLVDEAFNATLDYHACDRVFLKDTTALHVRQAGQADWAEYAVDDMPHYNEYIDAPERLWLDGSGADPAPKPRLLDRRAELRDGQTSAVPDLALRVKGFLPFANLEPRWVPGGSGFFPYMRFTLQLGPNRQTHSLLAADPQQRSINLGEELFDANFRWVDDPAELAALLHPAPPRIVVRIPSRKFVQELGLGDVMGKRAALGSTGYSVEVMEIYPRWSLAGDDVKGVPGSMVLVRVTSPTRTFMRGVVSPMWERSQDLTEDGQRMSGLLDSAIQIEAKDIVESGLTLVAGKVGLHALLVSRGGEVIHEEMALGKPAGFLNDVMRVTIDEVAASARQEERPRLIPLRERDAKQWPYMSLVNVELREGAGPAQEVWLPFSSYNYPTRLGYAPLTVKLPSGKELELLYSRQTLRLPAPVALEEFKLETFPGGTRERDYISLVRFFENGKWSDIQEVHSNNPSAHAGWWYFQSTWDPPEPRLGSAGLNFTGLGVGNRHGVWVMLLGGTLMASGTIWAFYVQPLIVRRRAREGAARREAAAAAAVTTNDAAATARTVTEV